MSLLESLKSDKLLLIAFYTLVRDVSSEVGVELSGSSIAALCSKARVNRSQVYEKRKHIDKVLENVKLSRPGRPKRTFRPASHDHQTCELREQVLQYRLDHPGALVVHRSGNQGYSDGFKRFVLDLVDATERNLPDFNRQVGVPVSTLRTWKRIDRILPFRGNRTNVHLTFPNRPTRNMSIVENYSRWEGSLRDFVSHEARRLKLPARRIQQMLITSELFPVKSGRIQEESVEKKKKRILEIVHDRPQSFDINRSNWTLASLRTAYQKRFKEKISRTSVGRLLKESGYTLKKAKRVLTSPDPDYREKVELLLHTLNSLMPTEMFFFVDELGPMQVKKYGGRIYAKKGHTPGYPQRQQAKGSISLAGALSATTNQISWIYGDTKDTSLMIDLIEILFNQYNDRSTVYITWDAASWHKSIDLTKWLDAFNSQTRNERKGPVIVFIPLPSSAQFLDVIEAVFSGMKRAVIHNSDYRSSQEMKSAISRHFHERNIYFKENPKRAGNKIWEIDFFQDHTNIKAGNYREY